MTNRISPKQFHESEGIEDWRVIGDGACAAFRTGSLAASARLVHQSLLVIPGATSTAEVMPFWRAALGYEPRRDSPAEDLVDPRGRGPGFCIGHLDARHDQRCAHHPSTCVGSGAM